MQGYNLPPDLDREIGELEELMHKYKRGEISATELKAHRVPFGVYEQRQADTYMVRIRCAAGVVTPSQLEGVAVIASQYGVYDIHITSRQELQIHYVKLDDIIPAIKELKKIGLATRGGGGNTIRNIVSPEDAGVNPQEIFDVTPYVSALTTRLISESDSWTLPRKFKIAFSGSAEDKGYATISDIGFIAVIKEGVKGFRVYAAGGLGAKSSIGKLLLDFIEEPEVYPVAKALKNVFYKYGNRKNKHAARLRFLWQSLGEEEFKKKFHEEYDKIKREGFEPLRLDDTGKTAVLSDLVTEEAGDAQDFALWEKRFVKPQKQADLFSVLIPVELGFISCERSLKLGRFLKSFGDDVIRMTKDQNFLLRNIPRKYLGNIYNFLKDTLQDFNRPAIFGRILSCAGASTCQLGICLSRQAARALMGSLKKSGFDLDKAGDIKLNISGCPNSCGQHSLADIGFFGKALRKEGRLYPAYNVLAGAIVGDGRTKFAEQVGEVAAKDLPALVTELLGVYLSKTEKFKTFQEYITQEGKEDLKGLCGRHREVPGFDENKNYYFDWGADTLFSLAERRAGECSAGLFDLLEMDLANIKRVRNKLSEAGIEENSRKQLLREVVFYSSRMLLITRGIEPKDEEELYGAFLRNFVETGLVAVSFKDIINIARNKDYGALLFEEERVHSLAREVELLYENMDNSFNFKNSASGAEKKGEERTAAAVKDFRGVACPLNFVKTKVELSKLKPGEILEIWLDDGAPIENVPGSVMAEGHRIVSKTKTGDHWSVVIEKK